MPLASENERAWSQPARSTSPREGPPSPGLAQGAQPAR